MPTAQHKNRTLTAKQRTVYDFIVRYMAENSYAPSLGNITDALGIGCVGTTNGVMLALERKGFVERIPGVARGLRVLKQPTKAAR